MYNVYTQICFCLFQSRLQKEESFFCLNRIMLGVGTWFVDQQALALDVLSKEVEVRFHCLRLWQHSAFLMNRLSRSRSIQWLLLHRRGDRQCGGGVSISCGPHCSIYVTMFDDTRGIGISSCFSAVASRKRNCSCLGSGIIGNWGHCWFIHRLWPWTSCPKR